MNPSELQNVANAVLRRAEQQSFVIPREIRAELVAANFSEDRWKEVVELLRESLNYRQGRYYFLKPQSRSVPSESNPLESLKAVLEAILESHRGQTPSRDRRQEERIDFSFSVPVRTEGGDEQLVLTRDLSLSGVRFLSSRSFLGRKLIIVLPVGETGTTRISLQVLWSTAVADGIYENGGRFLELVAQDQ